MQEQYEDTCISNPDNKYVDEIPWKENPPTLLDNRITSQDRTENIIKCLSWKPQYCISMEAETGMFTFARQESLPVDEHHVTKFEILS